MAWLRRFAAVAAAIAVAVLWFTLYRTFPAYPPSLGLPLALVAAFFLSALVLVHRIHRKNWPGLAQFGFVISAIGLGLWTIGGTMNALGLQPPGQESLWGRFARELLAQPQPGWGLFCAGLMPIGLAAFRRRLPLPVQLLLPLGGLLVLGLPLKYVLGERAGGLTVLIAFGAGWLAIAALLLSEASETRGTSQFREHV